MIEAAFFVFLLYAFIEWDRKRLRIKAENKNKQEIIEWLKSEEYKEWNDKFNELVYKE